MYLGKRKIYDLEKYEKVREECLVDKTGALSTAFDELEGLINNSAFAKQYMQKSQTWFSQRLNGCMYLNKARSFKEHEYHQIAEGFRDIAKRLMAHADEIDNAQFIEKTDK